MKYKKATSMTKPKNFQNGKWKEFNKHAVLVAEGNYLNNMKQGLWREYYDSGELMFEEYYNNGIQHGRFASYHLNGQLFSEGRYHNGLREGYFKIYNENGNNIRTLLFINNHQIEDIDEIPKINELSNGN